MSKLLVQKVYIDEDPNMTLDSEKCPDCARIGENYNLRYMYLNLEEAVYKCSSPKCMFPHKNFKFKNYRDKTVYRYKFSSSENDADQNGQTVDVDWIDSLAMSPVKKPESTTNSELLSLEMQEKSQTEAFSNAMDQLQMELNEILASHCTDVEKSETNNVDNIPTPTKSSPKLSPKKIEKPRKLSKCYDFIRQKSGGLIDSSSNRSNQELANQSSSSFKIPTQPVKESVSNFKQNLQSPKKHRSGRSTKRNSKSVVVSNKSSNSKEQKVDLSSDRLHAISFLNHVEKFNKTQNKPVEIISNDPVSFKIEILPQFNACNTTQNNSNIKIEVEGNRFNYYDNL